jgi:hypothetical protein
MSENQMGKLPGPRAGYDPELQMFTRVVGVDYAYLGKLRKKAEGGQWEHAVAGPVPQNDEIAPVVANVKSVQESVVGSEERLKIQQAREAFARKAAVFGL